MQHTECADKKIKLFPHEGGCSLSLCVMRPSKHGHPVRNSQTTLSGVSLHWTRTWMGYKRRTTGAGMWFEWIIILFSSKMWPSQPTSALSLFVDIFMLYYLWLNKRPPLYLNPRTSRFCTVPGLGTGQSHILPKTWEFPLHPLAPLERNLCRLDTLQSTPESNPSCLS